MTKHTARIEIYKAKDGDFRWRLLGGNGEIMLQGEGHPTASKTERAIRRGREVFPTALISLVRDHENGKAVPMRKSPKRKAAAPKLDKDPGVGAA